VIWFLTFLASWALFACWDGRRWRLVQRLYDYEREGWA